MVERNLQKTKTKKPIQLQSLKARELEVFFDFRLPAFDYFDFPGGHTAGATPVPIPNTEVKPRRADDTARVTVWERRSLPGLKYKGRRVQLVGPFLFALAWITSRPVALD